MEVENLAETLIINPRSLVKKKHSSKSFGPFVSFVLEKLFLKLSHIYLSLKKFINKKYFLIKENFNLFFLKNIFLLF